MFSKLLRPTFGLIILVLLGMSLGSPLAAQTIPSPAQAQQMLKNDPGAAARLQQMMIQSGLTPEQIRERLQEQGYPDSLLNQYMPGATLDSTAVPGDDIFGAVRALGIGDTTTVDSLRTKAGTARKAKAKVDSAFLDTLALAIQNDTTRSALRALLRSKSLQRQASDSGFRIFGVDLFRNNSKLFDANTGGGADPNYRFGAGDKLALFLTGDVQKAYPLTVNPDGFVVIPDVGRVDVAGKTLAQLEDALYDRLGTVYSGVRRGNGATTHFYVDMSQMGTNQVFVNGDVAEPSSYRVSRAATAMTALYAAGGPTDNGSMRNVQVRRNGQLVATVDVYDYALHGDASHDVRLENGDIVFVPPRGAQARVAGAVLRPATYEVKPGETLADVVQMAGGFTASADQRRVQIDRIVPAAERTTAGKDRSVVDVPSELASTTPVRDGDVIRVLSIANRVANQITVKGNVWQAGSVALAPNMRLSDALRRAGGLKPDSYLGQVLISRLNPDSTRRMLRTAVYDTTGRAVDDQILADGDVITVFSTTDFRPERYITVSGAVRKPGRQPYREGMTLRDAVLLADGLQDGALLTDAEVAHLPENRSPGVMAIAQDVPLDSTYLFGRGSDGQYIGPPGVPAPTATAPAVVLQPYDAVLIKRQPEWQLPLTVAIRGEVKSPGDYVLTSKGERLSDLVKRAGGLTTSANSAGIVFTRVASGVSRSGEGVPVAQNGVKLPPVRIGVDLPAVMRNPSAPDNITLVGGDSIFIPQYTPVVMVTGEVNAPTGIAYRPGADIDYYVRSAGGETVKGDFGRSYVMQPSGKLESRHRHLLFAVDRPIPQPGSTVTVPLKDPNAHVDWAAIMTSVASVAGSLVGIIAITRH